MHHLLRQSSGLTKDQQYALIKAWNADPSMLGAAHKAQAPYRLARKYLSSLPGFPDVIDVRPRRQYEPSMPKFKIGPAELTAEDYAAGFAGQKAHARNLRDQRLDDIRAGRLAASRDDVEEMAAARAGGFVVDQPQVNEGRSA